MSKEERFEIFNEDGMWVIKDNEQLPHLLDLYKSCVRLNDFNEKITDLQSQLAEKEKEIEYQENMKILAVDNQNKKAIEQLEKVKEKFGYKHNSQLVISSKNLVEFIDQQINELKGM